jgi:hypothetical protein
MNTMMFLFDMLAVGPDEIHVPHVISELVVADIAARR